MTATNTGPDTMFIIAGALYDDAGYYIERLVDPRGINDRDQYHAFAIDDYILFRAMLHELISAGDRVAMCPRQFLASRAGTP